MAENEKEKQVLLRPLMASQPQEEPIWECLSGQLSDRCHEAYNGPFQNLPWTDNLLGSELNLWGCSDMFFEPETFALCTSMKEPLSPALSSGKTMQNSESKVKRLHRSSLTPVGDRTCPICKKTFTRKISVGVHMVVHTNLRPYVCDYPGCHKKFNVKGNLQRHTKCHRAENGENEIIKRGMISTSKKY